MNATASTSRRVLSQTVPALRALRPPPSTRTRTVEALSPTSDLSHPSPQPTHYIITLTRSTIGLPSFAERTLASLGLKRRFSRVLHPFNPSTAGQILRVKELVTVRNVTEEEGERLMVQTRSEGSGVQPAGRVFGGGKTHVGVVSRSGL